MTDLVQHAIQQLSMSGDITLVSDQTLCDNVEKSYQTRTTPTSSGKTTLNRHHPHKTPVPATGLNQQRLPIAPIVPLHELAEATYVPTTYPDPYKSALLGPLLANIGTFDSSTGNLCLDQYLWQNVAGHNKTRLSDDLGIGFGITLGKRWVRALGAVGTLHVHDIDELFACPQNGFPTRRAAATTRLQPDYLIREDHPGGLYRFWLVECKGSTAKSTRLGQLAKATQQLESLELSGSSLHGVAVCTVATHHGITCYSVDPETAPAELQPNDDDIQRAVRFVPQRSEPLRDTRLGLRGYDRELFLARALATSNAKLAWMSGDDEAIAAWMPWAVGSGSRGAEQGTSHSTAGVAHGFHVHHHLPRFEFGVDVFFGVADNIVTALRTGQQSEITKAQATVRPGVYSDQESGNAGQLLSVSEHGTILRISAS